MTKQKYETNKIIKKNVEIEQNGEPVDYISYEWYR